MTVRLRETYRRRRKPRKPTAQDLVRHRQRRLIYHAQSMRKQAEEMPAGTQQEHLLRKAVEADEVIKLNDQLSTSGQPQPL